MRVAEQKGFSLAEILVVVGLLGVITAFTLPKVLNNNNLSEAEYNNKARETVRIVQAAYTQYRAENNPDANTRWTDITPYMDYVKVVTSPIDNRWSTTGTTSCTATIYRTCLLMKNGAVLHLFGSNYRFGDTGNLNALIIYVDPDGTANVSTTTDGVGKSLVYAMYYDGALRHSTQFRGVTTMWNDTSGAYNNWGVGAGGTPPWFEW